MAKGDPDCPAWMMTFGDAMSLLLTFFVMLIAFTDFDKHKLSEFMGIMRGAFNIEQDVLSRLTTYAIEDGQERPVLLSAEEMANISANIPGIKHLFAELLEDELGRVLYFRLTDEGLAIVIQAATLFEEQQAILLPGNQRIFKNISNLISIFNNEVRVTAAVPADAQFAAECGRTPWGFSARRGQSFAGELAAVSRQDADRFSLGVRVEDTHRLEPVGNALAVPDYVEVLIVERRQVREVVPEEVVIRDRWL